MCRTIRWIIAERCFVLLCSNADIPQIWKIFPPPFLQTKGFLGEADFTLLATAKKNWTDLDRPCNIRIASDEHGFPTVLVQSAEAVGFIQRLNKGYVGEFDLPQEHEFGVYTVLRVATALIAEEFGGLLIHASGVWRNGKVWVFCGPANAGKTTIANELKGDGKTFSEDEILLTFDENGRLIAHATPFGDQRDQRDCPIKAQVAGLVFIKQAEKTRVFKAVSRNILGVFYRETRWYTRDTSSNQRFLNIADRIINTGLCYSMEFTKDTSFWNGLREVSHQ